MTEKSKTKVETVKRAIIVPPALAEKIVALFAEMPRKFSSVIDPVLQEFMMCSQADVTLTPTEEPEKSEK
jgi:hypothetical protein